LETFFDRDMIPDLSLIIPCYNEATHLRESVAAMLQTLDDSRLEYEVVFVDDCSRDATREILEEICAQHERCRVLFHEQNRGRGAAFKTGFAGTNGEVAGFIDIDLEISPLYIPALVSLVLKQGYDVATGHRFYLFSQTRQLHRHAISKGYRWVCRLALGFDVKDSETGCKFFRRDTTSEVVLGSVNDGWFWDTEVMARAVFANLRISEMPVLFLRQPEKPSSVRVIRDTRQYLIDLHRFRIASGFSLQYCSPIYWTGIGYDLVMKLLYRSQWEPTYREVADRIPGGASVVDVCAGTARIYRDFLKDRACEYLGLDFSGHLVMSASRHGAPMRRFDLLCDEVPEADYVVMCSSFYHFHDREDEIFGKLKCAARKAVIISEPVENLLSRGPSRWSRLMRRFTNPGVGDFGFRHDLASFQSFAERHGAAEVRYEPGWRNAVAVFETEREPT
jgi:glycosyltransferase involved in cell wall biosynthesis